jgi:hypothetical protein
LKVTNNDGARDQAVYALTVDGLEGAELIVPPIVVPSMHTATVPVVIRVPRDRPIPATVPLTIHLTTDDDDVILEGTFKAPRTES